jgi:DNA-binding SARP family transcriptional activator
MYVYKRKTFFFVVLAFFIAAAFGVRTYFAQKKENSALRVKIISLNKEKKTPVPWTRLAVTKNMPLALSEKEKSGPIPVVLSDLTIDQIASLLTGNMLNIKNLNLRALDKNIEMADELISREPNSYSAYKAKLISMIYKESKFNQTIDEYELNKTLDNMASFEINNDTAARKEAALFASNTNQLIALQNKLDEITLVKDEVSTQSAGLDKSSAEYEELKAQENELSMKEQMAAADLDNFQKSLGSTAVSTNTQNEDIIEIPFLRLLAKSDYDAVLENAESYLEKFPNSPNVYYYLLKALELSGRNDEMIQALEDSRLSLEDQATLQDRLDASRNVDPTKYWENLNF